MLSDNSIRLRALEPDDLDMLYLWENDTSIWRYGNNMAPFSRKMLADYIDSYDGDIFKSLQLRFMIVSVDTDVPVGMIDLYDFDAVNRRAGVGIMVDEAHRTSFMPWWRLTMPRAYRCFRTADSKYLVNCARG